MSSLLDKTNRSTHLVVQCGAATARTWIRRWIR